MAPAFQLVAPDRLRIREGGGCLSMFGIPFFAAGVLLVLAVLGILPMGNADRLPALAWPLLFLMAIAFTAVGGALTFGRSWTIIDRSQFSVIKQWGLLVPLRERTVPLHGYTAVMLGFVEGDSDTADRFPIALKAQIGPDLPLRDFTAYAEARACATAVAEHLQLDFEDASTDHPVRLRASLMDVPFRERAHRAGLHAAVVPPPGARVHVTREPAATTIVITPRRMHVLVLAVALVPAAILLAIGPPLATFFRQSRTPDAIAWVFLGFLTVFFGVLPTMTLVNAFLRSRRGATIVTAANQGLRIQQRGAWTTRTIASFDGAEILDVDYSSGESSLESARRAAEQQVLQPHPSASTAIGPRAERILDTLARHAKGRGVTVKTRTSLTTFGQGLDESETRYLHALVCRALVE